MIYSYSKFYYGFNVNSSNRFIDFDEGSGELSAILDIGNYTFSTIAAQIQSKMNAIGSLTYTVSLSRDTRYMTISAGSNFDLLVTTGSNLGSTFFSEIGFTTNQTGSNTYTGGVAGSEYVPQFKLQSFVHADENSELYKPSINESTSGALEIISYGTRSYFEFDIKYITNIIQPYSGPILSNHEGVQEAKSFMDFSILRRPLEFMPDKDDPSLFYIIQLESTPEDGKGTRYKLKQNFGQLPDYYYTGTLVYRKLA